MTWWRLELHGGPHDGAIRLLDVPYWPEILWLRKVAKKLMGFEAPVEGAAKYERKVVTDGHFVKYVHVPLDEDQPGMVFDEDAIHRRDADPFALPRIPKPLFVGQFSS